MCDLIMIYFKEQYRTLSSKKIKIEKGIFFYFYFFLLIYDMNNETEYVKLISSDGFEFVIHREAAVRSGTIKNMLCGPVQFRESVENAITFRDIKYVI